MTEEVKAVVLGAGMTGLCAGHYLTEALGREAVLVLEATDYTGGTARTEYAEGFTCENGPNGFLDKEPLTLKWAEDLGIAGDLVRANEKSARRFIMRNGVLHEIKPPPAFLVSGLLSPLGRARLLCEPFIPAKKDDSPETIWDFAARRIGKEAADTLVAAMVSGVYGGDAKQLSLAHCFPKMAQMEREYGGLFKALIAKKKENKNASAMGPAGTLTSFQQGIGYLPQSAAARLGDRVRLNTPVTAVRQRNGRYEIETPRGTISAESVIVAAPTYAAAEFLAPLDHRLVETLNGVPYAGLAVLCAGIPREKVAHDLDGFGFLIPRTQKTRALGCIWTSTVFPGRAPEGYALLRTMFGGATDPDAVSMSDSEILETFQREIGPLLGIGGAPEFFRIYRYPKGIPQYPLGHGVRLKQVEEAERHFPGLIFAGNAYRGVSLNDCVVSAHRAVGMALEHRD